MAVVRPATAPHAPVLVCLSPPTPSQVPQAAFDGLFEAQRGFREIRHRRKAVFIEFASVDDALAAYEALQGRFLAQGVPPLTLDFDRFPHGRSDARAPRPSRPGDARPRRSLSPRGKRARSPPRSDRYVPEEGARHDERREKRARVEESKPYQDPFDWLRTVVPVLEAMHFFAPAPTPRLQQAESLALARASSTLHLTNLPRDVLRRELHTLLSLTPNFLAVTLADDRRHAEAQYFDLASAHVALVALQGFEMDDARLSIDFARR